SEIRAEGGLRGQSQRPRQWDRRGHLCRRRRAGDRSRRCRPLTRLRRKKTFGGSRCILELRRFRALFCLPEFADVCRNYFCAVRRGAQTRLTASRNSLLAGQSLPPCASQSRTSSASWASLFGTCTQPALLMQRRAISPQMLNQSCVVAGPRRRGGGCSGSVGRLLAGAAGGQI